MKKILSILLVVAMVFAIVACGGNKPAETTGGTKDPNKNTSNSTTGTTTPPATTNPGFDEGDVVFTFGAISDIHLEKNTTYGTEAKFQAALNQLLAFADDRGNILDAVAIVGDICETKEQITTFKNIYEGMNLPGELIFTLGNHDQEAKYSEQALTLKEYKEVLGDAYFGNAYNNLDTGDRHYEVNGQHFIVVQPESYGSEANGDKVTFSSETVAWLDSKLNEITTANPNAYVYVLVHAMIEETCYGSDLEVDVYGGSNGSYWYTSDLTSTLEKYPQVITFSGHLHFPINDERSIMQNKFTSIGTGSVAYLAIENGYANVSGTVPSGAGNTSSGHIVEVDSNGNVRVTRLNFTTGETMGDAWVLNAPTADGSHLKSYTKDRANNNAAPTMTGATAKVDINTIGGNRIANLTFGAGSDDSFVHHYTIKVTNTTDNTVLKDVKYLSDFWVNTNPEDMAKSIVFGLGTVIGGNTYKVEIAAVDSWGAKSDVVTTTTFEVPVGFDGTLPEALVDIDFNADGTATDKKGTGTVTLVGGATISSKDVTFKGVTKPMVGIHSSASGDSGTFTFTDYTLEDMSALYNGASGFSIEAFYVNRSKSGTQGIFCATEYGGLGFAEKGGGMPGLCVYGDSKKTYYYTADTKVSSATELTHVISTAIVYENNIYTGVYVNGALVDSQTIPGKVWMTDSRYAPFANQLSICNDIGNAGFPTTDCTVVDIKFYNVALNPEQVKTAYNNAAALFN
ncbi:MAG: metallophosphoesterase [Clostridia bacterium]|nr:metallophosphoesterase [Clostridia bacterium]